MTVDIGLVLIILGVSLVLFVSEKVRMDVTALIVLGALVVTGLVSPEDAVAGFANGAVIAVWAMFILSDGLTRTGIANAIGRTVLRFAGTGQGAMTVVIMLTGGVLSAFMNNIGVAVAMAASASFASPISHPANLLVMGPGGYRFGDYLKLGLPLTIVVFVAVMVLLPLIWPLTLV